MTSPVLERLIEGMKAEGIQMYRYPCSRTMYELLKKRGLMKCESHLVDQGGHIQCNGVQIRIMSKEYARLVAMSRRQPFVQRVYVDCDCGKQVPFGRLQQHKCK